MSVFPARTYKKGAPPWPGLRDRDSGRRGLLDHVARGKRQGRHPLAGGERVRAAGSLVPPALQCGHGSPARYLALHPPAQFSGIGEKVEDRARDQIEYPDEDPFIRRSSKRSSGSAGMKNGIPEEAYRDHNFEWDYDSADH